MRDLATIQQMKHFFQGNEEAVKFAMMFVRICDTWDDLIDQDVEVTGLVINRVFCDALIGIPRNRFYRQFTDELIPIIETGVLYWMASDTLKLRGGTKEMEVANVIRHDISNLFIHMARLIGGFDWAAEVAPAIRMLAQNDTLEEFIKG